MGKIDEAYIKYVLNQGDDNPDYLIVFKILDELKPYVELAEILIDNPTAYSIKWLFSGREFGLDVKFHDLLNTLYWKEKKEKDQNNVRS